MAYFIELPDGGGARRRTPLVPWVVAGTVHGAALSIVEPPLLVGSRPAGEWVATEGPVRIINEAERGKTPGKTSLPRSHYEPLPGADRRCHARL